LSTIGRCRRSIGGRGWKPACWHQPATAQLCIFEQWIEPGIGAPTHAHPVEEVLTVLEGEAEMWLDARRMVVLAGHSLIVPAGQKHGFRNAGAATLHIHAVLASPVFEATFEGSTETVRRWLPR
jgi:quercetin dioxygenase-like cupin family protein